MYMALLFRFILNKLLCLAISLVFTVRYYVYCGYNFLRNNHLGRLVHIKLGCLGSTPTIREKRRVTVATFHGSLFTRPFSRAKPRDWSSAKRPHHCTSLAHFQD